MPDLDFLFGAVKVDGSRDHGTGRWTSEFLSVGKYKITFNNRFERTPTIIITPDRQGSNANRAPISAEIVLASDSTRRREFEVNFRMPNGIATSTQFNFIAVAEDD